MDTFDGIAHALIDSSNSLLMLRFFSTELFNLIITQAQTCGVEVPAPEMERLLHFDSGREFYDSGAAFVRDICSRIQENLQQNTLMEKSRVIVYLQNHFKENDLSIPGAADALGISRQQINEVLKEDIGQGFAQYIASLRLQEFKRLLVSTDRTVQSLIEEVGYLDVPNFLRKFKNTEGITPTQYRTLHKLD